MMAIHKSPTLDELFDGSKPTKLPAPVPAAKRTRVLPPISTEPTERDRTLADDLRDAQGTAGVLALDYAVSSVSIQPVIEQFSSTGTYAREGRSASGIVLLLSSAGLRRLLLDVSQPGRARDHRSHDVPVGIETTIADPGVLKFLEDEVRTIRDTPITATVPMLVVLASEVVPEKLDAGLRDRLDALAADWRCCVAVVKDAPGSALTWTPTLAGDARVA